MARQNGTRDRNAESAAASAISDNPGAGADTGDRAVGSLGNTGAGAGVTTGAGADTGATENRAAKRADPDAIPGQALSVTPQRKTRRDAGTKRSARAVVPATTESDQIVVETVLMAVSGIAISVTGEEHAAINDAERAAIVPPAVRMLQRADQNARERIDQFADPIALLIGLGLYAERIYSLSRAKQADKPRADRPGLGTSQPVAPPQATRRDNPKPDQPVTRSNDAPSANPSGALSAMFGSV